MFPMGTEAYRKTDHKVLKKIKIKKVSEHFNI